jgi:hypothetical protein
VNVTSPIELISPAKIYLPDLATRLLMLESDGRLIVVGNLANDGSAAAIWTHTQDGLSFSLLRVNSRANWELAGDVEVAPDPSTGVTRVDVQHPLVFSACKAYQPSVPADTKATVEAAGHLTLRAVAAPLAGDLAVVFAADVGSIVAVPAMPPDATIVAEIHADGAWRMRRSWVVPSRLHCNLLHGYDFSGGAPATQTLGYDGSDLAYRSAAGTTWTLAP